MTNLAVDIGNTQVKLGLFDGSVLKEQVLCTDEHEIPLLVQTEAVEAMILSSVARPPDEQTLWNQLSIPVLRLTGETPLPFVNTYTTPATLGTDRIAAVAGAHSRYPHQNTLVIDAGTCITYDIIDWQARYRGGVITPGLRMRLQAMHTFTARLPLVELVATEVSEATAGELTARSTAEGLRSGAVRGTAAEISQMIRMYADKFSDLRVVMCGGDASYLLTYIRQDHSVTVVPELILIGLNSILQYNVNQTT